MKTKTIIPIAIVAIFVALAFSPAASATQVRVAWVENPDDANLTKSSSQMENIRTFMMFFRVLGRG